MKPLLITCLLFWCTILPGQSNDSIALFNTLLDKSSELRFEGQLDSALFYAQKLEEFPMHTIPEEVRIKHITNFAKLQGDITKAISILTEEQLYQENKKNYRNLAHIIYAKGVNYFDASYDHDALINFIKADSLLIKLNIDPWLAVMSKVGIVNVLMKSDYTTDAEKFDQAAEYIDEGIALADSIGFKVGSSILLEKKAHYLQLKDLLKESMKTYHRALDVSQSINYTLRESSIYDGMGKVYVKLKKTDSAAYYFEKHLSLIEATSFAIDIAEAHYNIGEFYNQTSNFPKAKTHLEEAWKIIQEVPEIRKEYPYKIQSELAISYSALNDHKRALISLNSAKDLLEEVHSIKNSENIRELETRYRTEKKEQEIALLKSQNQLAEQEKKSQRNLLTGGIVLTSLLGLFLFVLYRNRQKTNNRLRELDALKSNFFTNISHEFRTPLTLISSPIQETLAEPDLSDQKRSHFEMADRNTSRLLSLVDQLLDLSKIDSGNRKLELEKGTPMLLISVWCESFSYLAKQKNIDLNIIIENKNEEAWFDKDALEKIVVNLLSNAVKYTHKNGVIKVYANIVSDRLNFEISNNGKKLSKSQINAIFERFYQTDGQNDGTGIGLALVKELSTLHRGSVKVNSKTDQFTTFKVQLCIDKNKFNDAVIKIENSEEYLSPPLTAETTTAKSEEVSIDSELPILLVVEDSTDVRQLLTDTFDTDYRVYSAKDGEEGIALALEYIPDIILSDVMMPGKDGIDLTKTLKEDERSSHIPIILLTAKAGDINELEGLDVGADDYITKPFNKKILLTKVANIITQRKKLQSRYSQEVILKPKDIAITSLDEVFLEKVQRILDENLVESTFTIEEFSKSIGMSRMQLHRKLKALTGLSASEFIRSQRLKMASQILITSDQNVAQVGYSVGFNDSAYFTKCFREAYQCTPSKYSKKITSHKA